MAQGSARSLGIIIEYAEPEEPLVPIEFRRGEVETVEKVLDRIDQVSSKRIKEGFSKRNFQFGVLNYLMLAFVLGKYTESFWLVVLFELLFFIPYKIWWSVAKAKPLNEVFYFFDYCWVMNFFILQIALCLFLDMVTNTQLFNEERRHMWFSTIFGIACGPLLGATMVLPFVAVVFHDFVIMTGLFIHILPPMVMFTLKWDYQAIQEAWPEFFHLSYVMDTKFFPDNTILIIPGTGLGTIAGNTIAAYFIWFIPYVTWMLLIGMDLPRKNRKDKDGNLITPKYDTVFHSTVRTGLTAVAGKALWGRPTSVSKVQMENDDYERRDFLVYMGMHAVLCYLAVYILAFPCFCYEKFHIAVLILLTILCVARGAERYTYYVTEMYESAIRKDFCDLLEAAENKNK